MVSSQSPTLIIGGGLAAQLTAALLARIGHQVVHLAPGDGHDSGWNSCPPLLVRLLDSLDARSCLRPSSPLQIVTPAHQVELHGGVPLQDELRREFPRSHRQLLECLDELQRLAERLANYLWESEGLPAGWSGRLASPWQRLRHGLTGRGLNRPFKDKLTGLEAPEQEWLRVLLAGYACADWEQLSLAEAALAWAEVNSPQELSRSALREQLKNRLVENSGRWQQIDPATLQLVSGQPLQVKAGGQTFAPAALLSETELSESPPPFPQASQLFSARFRFVEGRPAGHLANRLLVSSGGAQPLRIVLENRDGDHSGQVQGATGFGETAEQLASRLTGIFPFSRFDIQTLQDPAPSTGRRRFPGLRGPLSSSPGSWNLDTSRLLPTLGNTGEGLLAMSLTGRLAH